MALALLGCALVTRLSIKRAPTDTLPGMTVSFSMPGMGARAIESEVTSHIESMLNRIEGIRHISSHSYSGGGSVTIDFDKNTNLQTARFETAMAIRQIWSDLPGGVSYPLISMKQVDDNASGPFMSYSVNASESPSSIMFHVERYIVPLLASIEGVANVEVTGATPIEWLVEYDTERMYRLGISTSDIRSAISAYCQTHYMGLAMEEDNGSQKMMSLVINPSVVGDKLRPEDIVVGQSNGMNVTLDRIARVSERKARQTSYFRINCQNAIYLNIYATNQANQIALSTQVKKVIDGIHLPSGYSINIDNDASESIKSELDNIYVRSGLTIAILLIFVGLVTMSIRYLLMIAISLTINLAIAAALYYMFGVEIHIMSLAGITISLNLVIDNLIVMTEHVTRRGNLKAFSAILAATMTTVGALATLFFADQEVLLSLKDFMMAVIINLAVSLAVALLLVPALIDRMGVKRKGSSSPLARKVSIVVLRGYRSVCLTLARHKQAVLIVLLLSFGLPVFMLPNHIDGDSKWANLYNKTLGSETYVNKYKPWVDRCLGGTLRLFVEDVFTGSYWNKDTGAPSLRLTASMPNGATVEQMNAMVMDMENFISQHSCVKQIRATVVSGRRAFIMISFNTPDNELYQPLQLKEDLMQKARESGGGNWSISGLDNQAFNTNANSSTESSGNYYINLRGYNYDDLYGHALRLAEMLSRNNRVKDISIVSQRSNSFEDYSEYYLEIDPTRMAADSLSLSELYAVLTPMTNRDGTVVASVDNGTKNIRMVSSGGIGDVWAVMNTPMPRGKINKSKSSVRLADYATIIARQMPPDIVKSDREYEMVVQYEYMGSNNVANQLLDNTIARFSKTLPLGYRAYKDDNSRRNNQSADQYWLLALIVVIIYFITAILFNSLLQPLAIILMIPVSYIGVFLTFWGLGLKFDSGGFASFVLLGGITVNAAIYIINQYNSIIATNPSTTPIRAYIRAFVAKITAIMLTVLSTILGFMPFVVGIAHDSFWFTLAAGTMGGLAVSIIAILFVLPTVLLKAKSKHPVINAPKNTNH